MIPGRGRVLLRRVESGESYPGGKIIIPEPVRDALMAQHAEVVAVGEPAFCPSEDDCMRPHLPWWCTHDHMGPEGCCYCHRGGHHCGSCQQRPAPTTHAHPSEVKSGDWVLVAKRAGVECGDDTGKSYLVGADEILAVLEA